MVRHFYASLPWEANINDPQVLKNFKCFNSAPMNVFSIRYRAVRYPFYGLTIDTSKFYRRAEKEIQALISNNFLSHAATHIVQLLL